MNRGEKSESQLIIDGTDPTIARTALQSGGLISKMYSIKKQEKAMLKRKVFLKKSK